jgi:hypothetical protein
LNIFTSRKIKGSLEISVAEAQIWGVQPQPHLPNLGFLTVTPKDPNKIGALYAFGIERPVRTDEQIG